MPIWLRNYTFALLEGYYSEKQTPQQPKQSTSTEIVLPDYIAKAPRN